MRNIIASIFNICPCYILCERQARTTFSKGHRMSVWSWTMYRIKTFHFGIHSMNPEDGILVKRRRFHLRAEMRQCERIVKYYIEMVK